MNDVNQPFTLIVGTGAMACLFAARLAGSGVAVTMLGSWPEGLQALQQRGARLVTADGSEQAFSVRATADPAACAGVRQALVLVKSWQTGRAANQLADCLHPQGVALTLQNGLGNYEALSAVLGAERVALGVTTTGATLLEAGRVRPVGGEAVSLGAHDRLKPLVEQLSLAGFGVEVVSDTRALLWGKLVINAGINPLTALLRVPNGELLTRLTARRLMGQAAREAAAVAEADSIRLPYPDAIVAVENVAQRTAANLSSMLRDVQRGAPTEIDAISGAIVQVGERVGVAAPLNCALWQLVKALENSSYADGSYAI